MSSILASLRQGLPRRGGELTCESSRLQVFTQSLPLAGRAPGGGHDLLTHSACPATRDERRQGEADVATATPTPHHGGGGERGRGKGAAVKPPRKTIRDSLPPTTPSRLKLGPQTEPPGGVPQGEFGGGPHGFRNLPEACGGRREPGANAGNPVDMESRDHSPDAPGRGVKQGEFGSCVLG